MYEFSKCSESRKSIDVLQRLHRRNGRSPKNTFERRIRTIEIDRRRAEKWPQNPVQRFHQSNSCNGNFNSMFNVMVLTSNRMLYYRELCIANFWKIRLCLECECISNYISCDANFWRPVISSIQWHFWSENHIQYFSDWLNHWATKFIGVCICATQWPWCIELCVATSSVDLIHYIHNEFRD